MSKNDRIEEMVRRAVGLGLGQVVGQGVDVVGAGQGSEPTRSAGGPNRPPSSGAEGSARRALSRHPT